MRMALGRKAHTRTWSLSDLQTQLYRFGEDLERAGLKPLSILTYTGRADTFLRWLAGEYRPRGPNAC